MKHETTEQPLSLCYNSGMAVKKSLLTLGLLTLCFVSLPFIAEARSGCCSWHGGVCGCSCCDGTPLSATCAPYYPGCNSGPSYKPTPTCPLFSSYDSSSGTCKCNYGYVKSGSSCISQDQACKNEYGYQSKYDSLRGGCACSYGYTWNKLGTSCITNDQACQEQLGYNSTYDTLEDSCKCRSGYVLDSSFTSCTSGDSYCNSEYGFHSSFDSLTNSCTCSYGYVFNENKTACISEDESCQEKFGIHSKSSLGTGCECEEGYELQGNICALPELQEANGVEEMPAGSNFNVNTTADTGFLKMLLGLLRSFF